MYHCFMKKIIFIILFIVATITILIIVRPQGIKEKTAHVPSSTPTFGPPPRQADDEVWFGKIVNIERRHLVVTVDEKDYDVVLSDNTFFKKGKKEDLAVGKQLAFVANPDEDGTYIARTIIIPASSSGELEN